MDWLKEIFDMCNSYWGYSTVQTICETIIELAKIKAESSNKNVITNKES